MSSRSIVARYVLMVGCIVVLGLFLPSVSAETPPTQNETSQNANNKLQSAQAAMQSAGSYHFSADVEQTLLPRPLSHLIGSASQRIDYRVEGRSDAAQQRYITVAFEGGGHASPAIAMLHDGTQFYLERDGVWEAAESQQPTGTGPGGDFLSYLAGAHDIVDGGTRETGLGTVDVIRFAYDGRQAAEALARVSDSPVAASFGRIQGTGELWINADGLPVRQLLTVAQPELTADYDSRLHMVIDYSRFGSADPVPSLTQLPDGTFTSNSSIASTSSTSSAANASFQLPDLPQIDWSILLVFLLASGSVGAAALLYRHFPRRTYAIGLGGLAGLLLGSAVFQPMVSAHAADLHQAEQQRYAASLGIGSDGAATPFFSTIDSADCVADAPLSDLDFDQDGLSDNAERCYGTNPYSRDTDNDFIDDKTEIAGVSIFGQRYYSDPLSADSNHDGLLDGEEYPADAGGDLASWDIDDDGRPNPWDDDNDDDGVVDHLDLSPNSSMRNASTQSLYLQAVSSADHHYIDFQLRPSDVTQLRYTQSTLDWPFDDKANIQDLNGSRDDLKLVPMLRIRSGSKPNKTLAANYGTSQFGGPDYLGRYEIFIPLSAVSDGGQIMAFQGRIAFEPGALKAGLVDTELVWAAMVKTDSYATVNGVENSGQLIEDTVVANYYSGSTFAMTGINITRSGAAQALLLRTPTQPHNDTALFQLMFGLNQSFMQADALSDQTADSSMLTALANRFNNSTSSATRWGIDEPILADAGTLYAHSDEMMIDLATSRTKQFLSNSPASGDTSLVMALELATGAVNMDGVDIDNNYGRRYLTLRPAEATMLTERMIKLSRYRPILNTWEQLDLDSALASALAQESDTTAALALLAEDYPDISAENITTTLSLFYATWLVGQSRSVQIDGVRVTDSSADDAAISNSLSQRLGSNLAATLISLTKLAEQGAGLRIGNSSSADYDYFASSGATTDWAALSQPAIDLVQKKQSVIDQTIGQGNWLLIKTALKAKNLKQTISAYVKAVDAQADLADAGKPFKIIKAKGFARAIKFLDKAGLVLELVLIWGPVIFGNFNSSIARNSAIAHAVAATIFAVIMFALAATLVGAAIVFAIALLDFIFWSVTGVSFIATAIGGLASVFYSADVDLKTRIDSADFESYRTSLARPASGVTVGNTMIVSSRFRGVILGDTRQFADSFVQGGFTTASTPNASTANAGRNCNRNSSNQYICSNAVAARYQLATAQPNYRLQLSAYVQGRLRYEVCEKVVFVTVRCRHRNTDVSAPDVPEVSTIYLDVFPAHVSGLWSQSWLTNYDTDLDGLPDSAEPLTKLSWDSDGDGLSDRFEREQAEAMGLNPLLADADGDGLDDRTELRYGTDPLVADTDSDGLTDAVELLGWEAELTAADLGWVFSDPLIADADQDGLLDSAEKANATSPHSSNQSVRLTFDLQNADALQRSRSGYLLESGDQLTLSLGALNPLAAVYDSSLSFCVPSFFDLPSVPALSGSKTVAGSVVAHSAECATGHHLSWDFSGANALGLDEAVSADITLTIADTASAIGSLKLSTSYQGDQLLGLLPTQLDNDDPSITISAPHSDTGWLGADASAYIIGGTASDPSSEIESVTVFIDGHPDQIANGGASWASRIDGLSDGVYALSAQAVDQVGRVSPLASATLQVDHTPPAASFAFSSGDALAASAITQTTIIPLSGAVSDSVVNGAASGVASLLVSFDDRPWEAATVDGNGWSLDLRVPALADAQGEHTIAILAVDQAGNSSAIVSRSVIVDVVEPTSSLTDSRYLTDAPTFSVGDTVSLRGVADDASNLPQPARPTELSGDLQSIEDATVWISADSIHADNEGVTMSWIGDFNGDRLADYVIGLPADGDHGSVTIVYGQAGDLQLPPDVQALSDSRSSFAGVDGAAIGAQLAAVGDANGDGRDDFVVVSPEGNVAYLVLGTPLQLGQQQRLDQPIASIVTLTAPAGQRLDGRIAFAGDVNDDTRSDFFIGLDDSQLVLVSGRPLFGPSIDVTGAALTTLSAASPATAIGVHDVTGDGYDDFVLAVPADQSYLFYGAAALPSSLASASASQSFAANRGAVAALGDVNGDFLADFMLADDAGHQLVFGGSNGAQCCLSFAGLAPAADGFVAAVGNVRDAGVETRGLNDIMLGNSAESAYLILGSSDLSSSSNVASLIAATIDGVEAAGNTPYAAAADSNADGSSDLLLRPSAAAASEFGYDQFVEEPFAPPRSQPVAAAVNSAESTPSQQRDAATILHVDDDGDCHQQTPCYSSIQAAVDASTLDATISVGPGVYAQFNVTNKSALTLRGVHADAVFVDAGGNDIAVTIRDSSAISLTNMTLRNSSIAIDLHNAGLGASIDPTRAITFDHLLIVDFADHAIRSDRSSTINVSHNTIVGSGAAPYISISETVDPDYVPSWSAATAVATAAGAGAQVTARDADSAWLLAGGNTHNVELFDLATSTFTAQPDSPYPVTTNSQAVAANGALFLVSDAALTSVESANSPARLLHEEASVRFEVRENDGEQLVQRTAAGDQPLATVTAGGDILALAVTNRDIYIGGAFTQLRDKNGATVDVQHLAVIDRTTGAISSHYELAVGSVSAIAVGSATLDVAVLSADSNNGAIYRRGHRRNPTSHYGLNSWRKILHASSGSDVTQARINQMSWSNDRLYVAGRFNSVGCGLKEADVFYCYGSTTDNIAVFSTTYFNDYYPRENRRDHYMQVVGTALNQGSRTTGGLLGPNAEVAAFDFTKHGLVAAGNFALAGPSNNRIQVSNIAHFNFLSNRWETLGSGLTNSISDVISVGENIYAAQANAGVWRWQAADEWQQLPDLDSNNLQAAIFLHKSATQPDTGLIAHTAGTASATLSRVSVQMHRLDEGGSWQSLAAPPATARPLALVTSGDGQTLYAAVATDRDITTFTTHSRYRGELTYRTSATEHGVQFYELWAYDIGSDQWQKLSELRTPHGADHALGLADGNLFLLQAGESQALWRYELNSNQWQEQALPPANFDRWGEGAALVWDGSRHFYVLAGDRSNALLRYTPAANVWSAPVNSTLPFVARETTGIAKVGTALVALDGSSDALYQFASIYPEPNKLTVANTLFVAPRIATTADWISEDITAAVEDYGILLDSNAWVGGDADPVVWAVAPPSAPQLFSDAAFKDATANIYRLTDESSVAAGYHDYRPIMEVGAGGCLPDEANCAATIQAALNSGANSVLLRAGQYREPVYLLNGVDLFGSSAEEVTLIAQDGDDAALISAESTTNQLSNLTLLGNGTNSAVAISDGAAVIVRRSILRSNASAIVATENDTLIMAANNNFIANAAGITAADCAAIDVRNTIFVDTSGAALDYSDCGQAINHSYNLYANNGSDMPENSAESGAIFQAPLFTDRNNDNYRLLAESPGVDGGNPSDPNVPGSGIIDVGYREIGQRSYYVDDDYCAGCPNDGLVWNHNAFSSIQAALDAAKQEVTRLRSNTSTGSRERLVTVHVNPGYYHQHVTMPSYVHLEGSGADSTIIQRPTCRSVLFSYVVHSTLSGFTIKQPKNVTCSRDAGVWDANIELTNYSWGHIIERNVLVGAHMGVNLNDGGRAIIRFNTIVDASDRGVSLSVPYRTGVQVRGYTRADVHNNIFSQTGTEIYVGWTAGVSYDYNLFTNNSQRSYDGLNPLFYRKSANNIFEADPQFVDAAAGNYHLSASSPAVDAANPAASAPLGGGVAADIGYHELRARPLTLLLGDESRSAVVASSGIAEVEVGVTFVNDATRPFTDTLPTEWTTAPLEDATQAVSYWTHAVSAENIGTYRIYSRATDSRGNAETDQTVWYAGSFIATDIAVDWLETPSNGNAPLELSAELSGYLPQNFGDYTIYFEVDGQPLAADWAITPFVADGTARPFRAWAELGNGVHELRAVAVLADGSSVASNVQTITVSGQNSADSTAPLVTVDAARGDNDQVFTIAVELNGSVQDADSGVLGVEVSLDNGLSWLPATVNGNGWSFIWEPPTVDVITTFPALLRARDKAGNVHSERIDITVDNSEPPALPDIGLSIAPEMQIEIDSSLTVTWVETLVDGAAATMLFTLDRNPDTLPAQEIVGTQVVDQFDAIGDWYAHVGIQDAAGHTLVRHIGPWRVNNAADPICSNRQRSMLLDGLIDLGTNEWLAKELLDDDERTEIAQQLFTTWDGNSVYVGWQGSWWDADGSLWLYFDTVSGGAAASVVAGYGLPFSADYALQIDGSSSGTLWQYDGAAWQSQPFNDFALGGDGGLEAHLPFRPDNLKLFAYAVDDASTVRSVFPTTNTLNGSWQGAYQWSDLCNTSDPSANQPRAYQVETTVTPTQPDNSHAGSDHAIDWEVVVTNAETQSSLTDVSIVVTTTSGLQFGPSIFVHTDVLPALAVGTVFTSVINAHTAAKSELVDGQLVTATVAVVVDGVTVSAESHRYIIDIAAPTVDIANPFFISQLKSTVAGSAEDAGGVAAVKVSMPFGQYFDAQGTTNWSLDFPYQNSVSTVFVETVDVFGNRSERIPLTLIFDKYAPSIVFEPPALITESIPLLTGSINEKGRLVEFSLDDQDGSSSAIQFNPATPRNQLGEQTWQHAWGVGPVDGATKRIRVRAVDDGNNTGQSSWHDVYIDNVHPLITSTQQIAALETSYGLTPTILTGTVSDGAGVAALYAEVTTPQLATFIGAISLADGTWHYDFSLAQALAGQYEVVIVAVDSSGNSTRTQASQLTVAPTPDLELAVRSSAATLKPADAISYTLTVTNSGVTTASAVSVLSTLPSELIASSPTTWQLGDLAPQASATVTLTGAFEPHLDGSRLVESVFVVDSAEIDLYQPNNSHAVTTTIADDPISAVTLNSNALETANNSNPLFQIKKQWQVLDGGFHTYSATVGSGSNVTYTWHFPGNAPLQGQTVSARVRHPYSGIGRLVVENGVSRQQLTFTVNRARPNLTISQSVAQQIVIPGERLTYTLSIRNHSSSGAPVEGAVARFKLPDFGSDVRFSASVPVTPSIASDQISWQLAPIAEGATQTIVVGFATDPTRNGVHYESTRISAPHGLKFPWNANARQLTARAIDTPISFVSLTHTPQEPHLGGSYQSLVTNKPVTFTPFVSGGTHLQYEWTFSDGSTSNAITPTHKFETAGFAWARLTVSNASGGKTATRYFTVHSAEILAQAITPIAQEIVPGDAADISFNIRNNGKVIVSGSQLTLTLPSNLTLNDLSTTVPITPLTSIGDQHVWQLPTLPAYQELDFTLAVTVANGLSGFVPLTATIEVAHPWDDLSNNNLQSAVVTASEGAIGGVTASGPAYIYVGDSAQFVSSADAGVRHNFSWSFGDGALANGSSVGHVYSQVGPFTPTVTVSNTADAVTQSVPINVIHADLSVSKSAPVQVQSGDSFSYTIRVTNTTALPVFSLRITETVVSEMSIISSTVTPVTATVTSVPNGMVWMVNELGEGDSAEITLYATAAPNLFNGVPLSTTASVSSPHPEIALADNSASAVISATERALTTLTVSADSPLYFDEATTLSADAADATGMVYTWTLDGATLSGATVSQTLSSVGSYSYTLSAANDVSMQTASGVIDVVAPNLTISTTTASNAAIGSRANIAVHVYNDTPLPVTGAVLSATLDAILHSPTVTSTLALTPTGSALSWQLDEIEPFEQVTVLVSAEISNTLSGLIPFTNTFSVSNPRAETTLSDNSISTVITATDSVISGIAISDSRLSSYLGKGDPLVSTAYVFTATTGSGTGVSYRWDFGDGAAAIGSIVTHTYTTVGSYDLTVTAVNSSSVGTQVLPLNVTAVDMAALPQDVFPGDTAPPPVVETVTPGTNVRFQAHFVRDNSNALFDANSYVMTLTTSLPLDGPILFGFPITETQVNSTTWQLRFSEAGWPFYESFFQLGGDIPTAISGTQYLTFTLTLPNPIFESDPSNNVLTKTVRIVQPLAGLRASNSGPVAVGTPIEFSSVITAGIGTPTSYTWSFGDGITATGAAPSHTYALPGSYTATVTATNATSQLSATTLVTVTQADMSVGIRPNATTAQPSDTITYTVIVSNSGILTVSDAVLTLALPVGLTLQSATSTIAITETAAATWPLAPLAAGSSEHITVTAQVAHPLAGSVPLSATATISSSVPDSNLSNNSATTVVTASDSAISNVTASNSGSAFFGEPVTFDGAAIGSNLTYTWTFGDGQSASGAATTHVYATAGTYAATLTVSNGAASEQVTTTVSVLAADLSIGHGASVSAIATGQPFAYSVVITNSTPLTVSDLLLAMQLPSNFVSADVQASVPISMVAGGWEIAELGVGVSAEIIFTSSFNNSAIGLLTSTAAISAPHATQPVSATATTTAHAAIQGLAIASNGAILATQSASLTATVSAGANVSYSWTIDNAVYSGVTVTLPFSNPGSYSVLLVADNGYSTAFTATEVSVVSAETALSASVPSQNRQPGDLISIVYTVTNNSPLAVPSTVISNLIPDNIELLQVSAASALGNNRWQTGALSAGASVTVTLNGRVATTATVGTYSHSASVLAFNDTQPIPEGDSSDNTATLLFTLAAPASSGLTLQSDSPAYRDAPITFSATVSPSVAATYSWSFGDGNSGSGAQPSHSYSAAGSYTAIVTATTSAGSVTNSLLVTVGEAALAINGSVATPAQAPMLLAGDAVSYTLRISNASDLPLEGVVVTATLPSRLSNLSYSSYLGLTPLAGTPYRWQLPTLAAGAVHTITVNGSVAAGPAIPLTFAASIASPQREDLLSDNNTTQTVAMAERIAGFVINQNGPVAYGQSIALSSSITAGGLVSYTWSFGDGATATGASAAHLYAEPGQFGVVVTATNQVSTVVRTLQVNVVDTDLAVSQTASAQRVEPDAPLSFTITVSNPSDLPISGIVLTDSLHIALQNVVVQSSLPITQTGNLPYVWQLTTLMPQQSLVLTLTGRVTPTINGVIALENVVSVSQPLLERDLTNNQSALIVAALDSEIAGLVIDGTSKAYIDSNLAFSATIAAGSHVTYEWNFDDGTQATGVTATHQFMQPGSYNVTVTARNGSSAESAHFPVEIVIGDLQLSQAVSHDQLRFGERIRYTLTFSNAGGYAVSNVLISDTLPSVLINPVVTSTHALISNADGWEIAQLDSGEYGVIVISAETPLTYPGVLTITNRASISSATVDHQPNNNASHVDTIASDDPITGLTAFNDGPHPISSTVTFSASVATGSAVNYSWAFGDGATAIGSNATHRYAAAGIYTATVTASNGIVNAQATTRVTILAHDLSVTQQLVPLNAIPGDSVTATVVVRNTGGYMATNVLLNQQLSSLIISQSITSSLPSVTSSLPLSWQLPDMAAGSAITVVIAGQLDNPITGTHSVTAVVRVDSTIDDVLSNNSAESTITVADQPLSDFSAANVGQNFVNGSTQFTTTLSQGTNIVYRWDFGDGSTNVNTQRTTGRGELSLQHSHIYTSSGHYTAVVTAQNGVSTVTATVPLIVLSGDLAITQTLHTASANPGEVVSYTLRYDNLGEQLVDEVFILHRVPSELISVTMTSDQAVARSAANGDLLALPPLTVGTTGLLTISGTVDPALTQSLIISNSAYIYGDLADDAPANNLAQTLINIRYNAPPQVSFASAAQGPIYEGDEVRFTLDVVDDGVARGVNQTFTVTVRYGDGVTETAVVSQSSQFTNRYLDNGTYTVTIDVVDNGGARSQDTLLLVVQNAAPSVTIQLPAMLHAQVALQFSAVISDASPLDTHSLLWQFENGDVVSDTLTPSYVYTRGGVFTVTLTVRDDDGGEVVETVSFVIEDTTRVTISAENSHLFKPTSLIYLAAVMLLIASMTAWLGEKRSAFSISVINGSPRSVESWTSDSAEIAMLTDFLPKENQRFRYEYSIREITHRHLVRIDQLPAFPLDEFVPIACRMTHRSRGDQGIIKKLNQCISEPISR